MAYVTWTGHPFVDAGLAALAALAQVRSLEDLRLEHLQEATHKLQSVFLSDQALGVGVEPAFVSGPLSQLFPNSEIVNPSPFLVDVNGKRRDVRRLSSEVSPEERQAVISKVREKFRQALERDLRCAATCLSGEGEALCTICGRRVPKDAVTFVRKDKMPLLEGIVNFYPAFSWGIQVCGLCTLALRFLPFSVMRAGNRLWILHMQSLPVAARIATRYGWQHHNFAIAQNRPLDFFGNWETVGEDSTILCVLCELLEEFAYEVRVAYENPLPTVAYIFSNDNRGGYIRAVHIPNAILTFLAKLQHTSVEAFRRFSRELFHVPRGLSRQEYSERAKFVQETAHRLLAGENIVSCCLIDETESLAGGWVGHRLYLGEVRGMHMGKLAILERLGTTLAQQEERKKLVAELRTSDGRDLYGLFLKYVKKGFLRSEEFYALFSPNEDTSLSEARDIVLAVIYEWQRSQERGEAFSPMEQTFVFEPDATITRIRDIGARLLSELSNPSQWISKLQTARTGGRIRGVYLSAVQRGILGFEDFIFLAPFGDQKSLWLLRDYLLAFLFEHAGSILPEEDVVFSEENEEV